MSLASSQQCQPVVSSQTSDNLWASDVDSIFKAGGTTGCPNWLETWVGLTLILAVPLSAQFCLERQEFGRIGWAAGNMVDHPNLCQSRSHTRWATLYKHWGNVREGVRIVNGFALLMAPKSHQTMATLWCRGWVSVVFFCRPREKCGSQLSISLKLCWTLRWRCNFPKFCGVKYHNRAWYVLIEWGKCRVFFLLSVYRERFQTRVSQDLLNSWNLTRRRKELR